MKISSWAPVVPLLNRVSSKSDSDNSQQKKGSHPEQEQNTSSHHDETLGDQKQMDELIEEAVAGLRSEESIIANGLEVTQMGQGPGLRVILKDNSGSVVRTFTGEEFVKLRNAVQQASPRSGKILDQKL